MVAEHRHVFDADHRLEAVGQVECAQHAPRIVARRIGQDELAPPQPLQRGPVVVAGAQARLQPGQPVRLGQEMRGAHRMVTQQAEQRGAVVGPVMLTQRGGLGVRQSQVRGDVLGHRHVGWPERRVTGVVQRVVEVEKPDAPAGVARLHGIAPGRGSRMPVPPAIGPWPARPTRPSRLPSRAVTHCPVPIGREATKSRAGRAPRRSQAGPHPVGASVDVPVARGVDSHAPSSARAERRAAPEPARTSSGVVRRTRWAGVGPPRTTFARAGRAPGRSRAGPCPLGGSSDVPVGRGAPFTATGSSCRRPAPSAPPAASREAPGRR